MELATALEMGRALMREHKLIEQGWCLKVDHFATRRLGQCRPARREIGLTKSYIELNEEHEIRSTMLHEIAHALVGCHHGHDAVWKAKAIELGDDGHRCSSTAKVAPARFIGRCGQGCEFPRDVRWRGVRTCRRHHQPVSFERSGLNKGKKPLAPVGGRSALTLAQKQAKYPWLVEIADFAAGGRTHVIACVLCGAHRQVKPQDVFQVKMCVRCKDGA